MWEKNNECLSFTDLPALRGRTGVSTCARRATTSGPPSTWRPTWSSGGVTGVRTLLDFELVLDNIIFASRFGPKVRAVRPRVVQALGYDVMLQCEVESFPTSAIDWTIRDFLIENEDRFRVTHFNTGPTSTRTTLKVCLYLHFHTLVLFCVKKHFLNPNLKNKERIFFVFVFFILFT